MPIASQKILYSVFCQGIRKRRSIDDIDDINVDDSLAFTSWDTRKNSTIAEKSCMTFKTTIDFIGDLTKKLSDMLTNGQNVLKISESVSTEVDEIKSQLNGSTEVYVSQMKMLSSISVEISGFQKRSNTSSLYKT